MESVELFSPHSGNIRAEYNTRIHAMPPLSTCQAILWGKEEIRVLDELEIDGAEER